MYSNSTLMAKFVYRHSSSAHAYLKPTMSPDAQLHTGELDLDKDAWIRVEERKKKLPTRVIDPEKASPTGYLTHHPGGTVLVFPSSRKFFSPLSGFKLCPLCGGHPLLFQRECKVGPEMRSLLPLILYCISLVSLQQLLTLAQEESPGESRLDFLNKLFDQREDKALDLFETTFFSSASRQHLKRLTVYLGHLAWARPALPSQLKQQPLRVSRHRRRTLPSLAWALPMEGAQVRQRLSRVRRHATLRGGHYQHSPQLMRVGCVLGTCQVQNLSHRLYQLIGQSGRDDSSPINPRSPHSFG